VSIDDPGRSRAAVSSLWAASRAWWGALPGRDRRLLQLAATVLLLYLLWAVGVQPAWRTLARAPTELDTLEAQLQTMQHLASEANQLRSAPPVTHDQAVAALHSATDRLGDQGHLSMQGDRAVLTVTGAGATALRSWLGEARSGARARPVQVTLTRASKGYNGTIVVAFGGES
jgi:general secretion pathway protein M